MGDRRVPKYWKYELELETKSGDIREAVAEVVAAMDEMAELMNNPRWAYRRRRAPPMPNRQTGLAGDDHEDKQKTRFNLAGENVEKEMLGHMVTGNKQIERDVLKYLLILSWDRAVFDRDVTLAGILRNLERMKNAARECPSLQVQVNEYVEAMNAYVEEYRQNMFRNSAILLPLSTEEGVAQNAADTDITSE